MAFKNSLTLLTILICVESSLTVFSPSGCHAQETAPSSETVTLVEKVQIPVEVDGKEVGKTSLPAGTKVTVVSRDGARVSIKRGNLGPVWVEQSQLSGLSDKKPEQSSKPVESDPTIELQKLNRLVSEKQWTQVAATCETMAQADEKFSSLGELAGQLTSALQAQISAVQQQKNAEVEAKRLRRNADVVGQPNRLNPSDRSPMERAQKLRSEADALIKAVKDALETSEAQIAQLGTQISSEVSEITRQAKHLSLLSEDRPSTPTSATLETGLPRVVGDEGRPDFDETKVEAEGGEPVAQFNYAMMHYKGDGTPQNYEEAVKWLNKSAESFASRKHFVELGLLHDGLPTVHFWLGVLHHRGHGLPQDSAQAAQWFQRSAEQGDAGAQRILGAMYRVGDGVEQDNEKAIIWLRKAADQGDAGAREHLANMTAKGSSPAPEQPTNQFPATDAQNVENAAARNKQAKTPPDDKFGKLGTMRVAGVFSVENYQRSANERREAFASGAIPQIGMDYQTCVERFPVSDFKNNAEQRDARYSEWVVTLDEGWTRALFRVGDLFADILFSPEQKAEFISLEHINRSPVFVLSDEPLKLLCRGIAPGYEWSLEVADRRTKSDELRWEGMGTRDQAENLWVASTEKVLIAHTSRAHAFVHKYRDALDRGKQPNSD